MLSARRRNVVGPRIGGKAFRSGLVICSSLRHCSMGRSTAVSTPRLVTICGPSERAVSRNSLNLALASWTDLFLLMVHPGYCGSDQLSD